LFLAVVDIFRLPSAIFQNKHLDLEPAKNNYLLQTTLKRSWKFYLFFVICFNS